MSEIVTYTDRLIQQIKLHALEFAPEGETFTLSNGGTSKYYLDLRKMTLRSDGLRTIVDILYSFLTWNSDAPEFDAIGGPCVGADPIVGGLLHRIGTRWDEPVRGFLVRKQAKEHGKRDRVIGGIEPADHCILIEDVTTSGKSSMEAVKAVDEFGARVVEVVSVVDRLAGAKELFEANNVKFRSILTIRDLGITE